MTERMRRRGGLYAAYAVAHAVLGLVLLVLPSPGDAGTLAWLVLALPVVIAWGPFQADVAMTPMLAEAERTRWRIALWLFPWSMALYWVRFVRPLRA